MRKIRTQLVTIAAVVASTGASYAADMAVKAPPPAPPPAPVYNWTGWYVGLNAGGRWGGDCVDTTTTQVFHIGGLNGNIGAAVATQGTGQTCPNGAGFIIGGQIGYNWQFNNWVTGIETDIDGVSRVDEDSITNIGRVPGSGGVPAGAIGSTGLITSGKDLKWLGTVRGRLGWLATPTFLVYGTGGLAYGGVQGNTTITETLGFGDTPAPFGTSGGFSGTRTGWTAGGGVEWMLAPRWSVKVEYLYYDLGTETWSLANINQFGLFGALLETVSSSQSKTRFNGNIARLGINWHF